MILKLHPETIGWIMAEVDMLLDQVSETTGHGKAQRAFHSRVMDMLENIPNEVEIDDD